VSEGLFRRPDTWLATGFGAGFLWPAPGTWGTLLGLVIFILVLWPADIFVQLAAWVIVTLVGTWSAERTARAVGSDDPSIVVVDEVAAMWLAAAGLQSGWGLFLAFIYFRIFDIIKPFPARWAERLHGGIGIMADDVIAAIYAQAAVWLTLRLWT
jgi:phosphatidylglycerophosphatase A